MFLIDPLQERVFGRLPALAIAANFSLCTVVGQYTEILPMRISINSRGLGSAYTQNWQQLLVCRALLGIGVSIIHPHILRASA